MPFFYGSAEVYFLLMYFFILTCIFLILDDVDRLNAEEKAFVEDPGNEDFFDARSVKKRSRENSPSVTGVAKKMKTSNDEVSKRVSVAVLCILYLFFILCCRFQNEK